MLHHSVAFKVWIRRSIHYQQYRHPEVNHIMHLINRCIHAI